MNILPGERNGPFTVGEVAKIVGIPVSRAKNWTIGRPFWILPQVSSARGTGSRSLYSIVDVYRMAFAAELSKDGFSPEAIKRSLLNVDDFMLMFGHAYDRCDARYTLDLIKVREQIDARISAMRKVSKVR